MNLHQAYIEANLYNHILSVCSEESKRYAYNPDTEKNIVVIDKDGNEYARIPMTKFLTESKLLFEIIKASLQRSFAVPGTECFMSKIGCAKLNSPTKDNADIHIVIHDLRTNMTPMLGFCIKSMLGKDSTLFNYSEGTNITYKITGGITQNQMGEINQISDQLERMDRIYDLGLDLEFSYYNKENFYCNLQLVDTLFPEIMAELVRLYFYRESDTTSVKSLLNLLQERNTFGISNAETFYPYKMKQFLVYVALGMTATDPWNGRYDANGGYIVVKKDGDIVCYHFYDRNDIEDYLFNNTRFDNPSRDRCGGWGSVFKGDDDNFFITLNFQIKSLNNKQRITQRIRVPRS